MAGVIKKVTGRRKKSPRASPYRTDVRDFHTRAAADRIGDRSIRRRRTGGAIAARSGQGVRGRWSGLAGSRRASLTSGRATQCRRPQWRGPLRTGGASQRDLLLEWPAGGPRELWRIAGGDGYSSLAVSGGMVYSMVGLDDGSEAVVAWDAANGAERWRHAWKPATTFQYGGPRSTPTVASGRARTGAW